MEQEKLANLMSESRLISAADNVLYPLIQLKIQNRINLACSKFVGGELNFVGDVAYIQGLKEIEQELRRLQTAGNKAHEAASKSNLK
jgi:hypothetical protein